MRRASAALAVLAMLLVAGQAAAEDDFLDHYKAGLAAVGRREWKVAAERMRQAIAGKAEEDPRLARRLYLRRYLPHYFLGRSLFESGDCTGALAAWEQSERQGVVQQFEEEHRQLVRDRDLCRGRMAAASEADAALAGARQRLSAAEEAARRVRELAGAPELAEAWEEGEPSLASRERSAADLLASARQKLPASATAADLPRLREASDLASQALSRFEEMEREARQRRSAVSAERAGQVDDVKGQLEAATTLLGSHSFLEPYPPEISRRRAELEAAMAAVEALSAGSSPAQISEASQALEAAQGRLKKALVPPPDVLSRAAEAYFRADYQRVLDLLAEAPLNENRARSHAALFRAAARFGLWVASGERDAVLLEAARADIRACRETDPRRTPSTLAFSPRFVELFNRETAAQP